MNNIENIAEELFNKIRSRFAPVVLADEEGKPTDKEREARLFTFPYKSMLTGRKIGMLDISIVDERSLKISYTKNMPFAFKIAAEEQEWEHFVLGMRKFAKRNIMNFDIRDIGKDMLTKRDKMQIVSAKKDSENSARPMAESIQWSGTTRTSIQDFGEARLVIRHSERVDEEKPGARSRKIESMFVETTQGERFRMPFNRLSLGRAMTQHVAHGGRVYDEAGQYITGMAEEMNNLAFFVRSTRNRQFEDTETSGMVEAACGRYNKLRETLQGLSKTRNYHAFAENFVPEDTDLIEEYDIDALKERFVKKMFDDRLTDALPYVYRAYQQSMTEGTGLVQEFSEWADELTEGEWDGPDEPEQVEQLRKIMQKPILAGPDGDQASSALEDIIGSDALNRAFADASQGAEGDRTDVRLNIIAWLGENGYEQLAAEFRQLLAQQVTAQQPVNPAAQDPNARAQPQVAAQQIPAQSSQPAARENLDLSKLRVLAGVK